MPNVKGLSEQNRTLLVRIVDAIRAHNRKQVNLLHSVTLTGANAQFYQELQTKIKTLYFPQFTNGVDDSTFQKLCELFELCLSPDAHNDCTDFWSATSTNSDERTPKPLLWDLFSACIRQLASEPLHPDKIAHIISVLLAILHFTRRTDLQVCQATMYHQLVLITASAIKALENDAQHETSCVRIDFYAPGECHLLFAYQRLGSLLVVMLSLLNDAVELGQAKSLPKIARVYRGLLLRMLPFVPKFDAQQNLVEVPPCVNVLRGLRVMVAVADATDASQMILCVCGQMLDESWDRQWKSKRHGAIFKYSDDGSAIKMDDVTIQQEAIELLAVCLDHLCDQPPNSFFARAMKTDQVALRLSLLVWRHVSMFSGDIELNESSLLRFLALLYPANFHALPSHDSRNDIDSVLSVVRCCTERRQSTVHLAAATGKYLGTMLRCIIKECCMVAPSRTESSATEGTVQVVHRQLGRWLSAMETKSSPMIPAQYFCYCQAWLEAFLHSQRVGSTSCNRISRQTTLRKLFELWLSKLRESWSVQYGALKLAIEQAAMQSSDLETNVGSLPPASKRFRTSAQLSSGALKSNARQRGSIKFPVCSRQFTGVVALLIGLTASVIAETDTSGANVGYSSSSKRWVLDKATAFLRSTHQIVKVVDSAQATCGRQRTVDGFQLTLKMLLQHAVGRGSVVEDSGVKRAGDSCVEPQSSGLVVASLNFLRNGPSFGAMWLLLHCMVVVQNILPLSKQSVTEHVKAASFVLIELSKPSQRRPGTQESVLYVQLLPFVFDVACYGMRRRKTSSAPRRMVAVYDACASDLGIDVCAHLYEAWSLRLSQLAHHSMVTPLKLPQPQSPNCTSMAGGPGKNFIQTDAQLCDVVLAQLTFGVCYLVQQLRLYDDSGAGDEALELKGVVYKLGLTHAQISGKINDFPSSNATSLKGYLPIFAPAMFELRQLAKVPTNISVIGERTFAHCYYYCILPPLTPDIVSAAELAAAGSTPRAAEQPDGLSTVNKRGLLSIEDFCTVLLAAVSSSAVDAVRINHHRGIIKRCIDHIVHHPVVSKSAVDLTAKRSGSSCFVPVSSLSPSLISAYLRVPGTDLAAPASVLALLQAFLRVYDADRASVQLHGTTPIVNSAKISRILHAVACIGACSAVDIRCALVAPESQASLQCSFSTATSETHLERCLSEFLRIWIAADLELAMSTSGIGTAHLSYLRHDQVTAAETINRLAEARGVDVQELFGLYPYKLYFRLFALLSQKVRGVPRESRALFASRTMHHFCQEVLLDGISEQRFTMRAAGFVLSILCKQRNEAAIAEFSNLVFYITRGSSPPSDYHRQLIVEPQNICRVAADILIEESDPRLLLEFLQSLIPPKIRSRRDDDEEDDRFFKKIKYSLRFLTWELGSTKERADRVKMALLRYHMLEQGTKFVKPVIPRDMQVKQFVTSQFIPMMHNLHRVEWLVQNMHVHQPFFHVFCHLLRCVRAVIAILGHQNVGGATMSNDPVSKSESVVIDLSLPDDEPASVLSRRDKIGTFLPSLVSALKEARSMCLDKITTDDGPSLHEIPTAHWMLLQVWQCLLDIMDGVGTGLNASIERLCDVDVTQECVQSLKDHGAKTLGNVLSLPNMEDILNEHDITAIELTDIVKRLCASVWDKWAVDILVELLEFWSPPETPANHHAKAIPSSNWQRIQDLVCQLVRVVLVTKVSAGSQPILSSSTLLKLPDLPIAPEFAESQTALDQLRRGVVHSPPTVGDFLLQIKSKLQGQNPILQQTAMSQLLEWLKSHQNLFVRLVGTRGEDGLNVPLHLSDDAHLQMPHEKAGLETRIYSAPSKGNIPTLVDDLIYLVIDSCCNRGQTVALDSSRLVSAEVLGFIGAIDPALLRAHHKHALENGSPNVPIDKLAGRYAAMHGKTQAKVTELAVELLGRFLAPALVKARNFRNQNVYALSIQQTLRVVGKWHNIDHNTAPFPKDLFHNLSDSTLEIIAVYWTTNYFPTNDTPRAQKVSSSVLESTWSEGTLGRNSASSMFNYWLTKWLRSLIPRTTGFLAEFLQGIELAFLFYPGPDLCLFVLPKVVMQLCYPGAAGKADPYTLGHAENIGAISTEINQVLRTAVRLSSQNRRESRNGSSSSRTSAKQAIVNLCRQAVFQILDAVQKEFCVLMVAWPRVLMMKLRASRSRRSRIKHNKPPQFEHALLQVIDHQLLVRAALQAQDFARALQYFEYDNFLHDEEHGLQSSTKKAPSPGGHKQKSIEGTSKSDVHVLQNIYLNLRDLDGLSGLANKTRAARSREYDVATDTNSKAKGTTSSHPPSDSQTSSGAELQSHQILNEAVDDLLHQVIQHEDERNWKSALTCYEKALQLVDAQASDKDNHHEHVARKTKLHQGIVRCMDAMGHQASILAYVDGLVYSHNEPSTSRNILEAALLPHAVEAAWKTTQWDQLSNSLSKSSELSSMSSPSSGDTYSPHTQLLVGKALLALQRSEPAHFKALVSEARLHVARQIDIVGSSSYARVYPSMLTLHFLADMETLQQGHKLPQSQVMDHNRCIRTVQNRLFRTQLSPYARERICALHRCLMSDEAAVNSFAIGHAAAQSWLHIAKVHFVAGSLDSALSAAESAKLFCDRYSKVLQSRQEKSSQTSMVQVQVLYAQVQILCGRIHREKNQLSLAVQEMERFDDFLTDNTGGSAPKFIEQESLFAIQCLGYLLRTEWMQESACLEPHATLRRYKRAIAFKPSWEYGYFSLGRYYDKMLVQIRSSNGGARGTHANSELKVVFEIIQNYGHALRYGHSHIFQSLPRLLTLWFEAASMISSSTRAGKDLYRRMVDLARDLPAYQWLTALPQLISRISHNSSSVYKVLAAVLVKIVKAFPSQSLWTIIGASETANVARKARFREILTQAKKNKQRLSEQINVAQRLVRTLNDIAKETQGVTHKAPYDVKRLQEIPVRGHNILMPLQSALTPHLPAMDLGTQSNPSSNGKSTFLDSTQVFPDETRLYILGFHEQADVMASKEKPKRIKVNGTHGSQLSFLVKAEKAGDLRKDMRMMELCTVINRLLHEDVAGQQRSLSLRTFAVTPLSDRCGIIEWVNNTTGIRMLIRESYISVGLPSPTAIISPRRDDYEMIQKRSATQEIKVRKYRSNILKHFPRLMHRWFMRSTANPTEWFNKRQVFARSSAVWSIVGYFLGLGDRHGENIMCDKKTGQCVHVDFDCLFDKGLALTVPEVVPFRLTPNMINAFGITGYDGDFRRVCETTARVMRSNRGLLMNVLEAFLHDPLVEWRNAKKTTTSAGKTAAGALRSAGSKSRREALGVPPSQKRSHGGVRGPTTIGGASAEVVNDNAQKIINRIGQRLRGLYQSKLDLLFHDPEFERFGKRVRAHVPSFAQEDEADQHGRILKGSTATYIANRLPLSVEGQVNQLIEEATDDHNLCNMYIGWMPFL